MRTLLCLVLLLGFLSGTFGCYCFNNNAVNIRDAPCGNIIGTGFNNQCHERKNGREDCSLSGTVYTYLEFDYNGQSGWAAEDYLNEEDSSYCQPIFCGNVEIVSREAWGARDPVGEILISTPVPNTFIHHTVTSSCYDLDTCSARCRSVQNYHMDDNGWADIGYSFLIGEDGRAYEGRGWGKQGAHTSGYNTNSHGISVIGTFTDYNPNQLALDAINNLIDCGIDNNQITNDYKMGGHRDVTQTACPGDYFYDNWVTQHERWSSWSNAAHKE